MFVYHTKETASSASHDLIDTCIRNYGFYPNLHKILAEAPAAYRAYLETFRIFTEETTLSPLEQQVVMQTANVENRCHYCTAGHTLLMKMAGMPEEVVEALRENQPLVDPKLQALRTFVRELINARGHIGDDRLHAFFEAGYNKRHALEVLTGIATKLLSNYTNALVHTELEDVAKPAAWTHPDDRPQRGSVTSA